MKRTQQLTLAVTLVALTASGCGGGGSKSAGASTSAAAAAATSAAVTSAAVIPAAATSAAAAPASSAPTSSAATSAAPSIAAPPGGAASTGASSASQEVAAADSAAAAFKAALASAEGSAAPTSAATAASACNYLTPAEVTTIMNVPYSKPPTLAYGICSWVGADGNAFTVTLTKGSSAAQWAEAVAGIVGDFPGKSQPISGLGDKAAGAGLEIAVQSGNYIIDIRGADSPGFGKWPKSTALANAIIANLK